MRAAGWTIRWAALLTIAASAPARAQDREFCANRPDLGTGACIVPAGRLQAEAAVGDWTSTRDAEEREDSMAFGDLELRYGLDPATEVQLGWTVAGTVRTRDRSSGEVQRRTGTGDVRLAVRRNLRNPDGRGTSYGVQPFVTLPTGRAEVGAGTWGAGLIVPVGFDLADGINLALSPEVDAAPDEDGHGRHLAYGGVVGLGMDLSDAVIAVAEISAVRDRDPEMHATELLGALSVGWRVEETLQLDVGGAAGLNHASPDVRLFAGVARRF